MSLGEYSALVFAGVMDFEAGLKVVQERGAAMQAAADAVPSGMVSILGLELPQVEALCQQAAAGRHLAGRQSALSGEHRHFGHANRPASGPSRLPTAAGAMRAVPLAVAGAFHTPIMQPAVNRLTAALADVPLRKPRIPVVSNVDAQPHDDPEEIRQLLIRQVVSPVRWEDSMRRLLAIGCDRFYEVGPGRVLRGLMKRIDRKAECREPSERTRFENEITNREPVGLRRTQSSRVSQRLKFAPTANGTVLTRANWMNLMAKTNDAPPARLTVDLAGQVALVTGASRGIGRATAIALARCGARVACVARNAEKLAETVAAIQAAGGSAEAFECDVTKGEAVQPLVEKIAEGWGRLDIVVNNAGITRDTLLPRMADDQWDDVIDTNLRGTFLFTRAATRPMMQARYGRIINISSVSGIRGNPGQANYSASKAAVIGFSRTVARELASRKITVNVGRPRLCGDRHDGRLGRGDDGRGGEKDDSRQADRPAGGSGRRGAVFRLAGLRFRHRAGSCGGRRVHGVAGVTAVVAASRACGPADSPAVIPRFASAFSNFPRRALYAPGGFRYSSPPRGFLGRIVSHLHPPRVSYEKHFLARFGVAAAGGRFGVAADSRRCR